MSVRAERLNQIQSVLGRRRLAWYGIRGIDALPYQKCGLLRAAASEVAPLAPPAGSEIADDCLETHLKSRVDHNRYQVDLDTRLEARSFREDLLARRTFPETGDGWVLVAYRPAEFLAAVAFTRDDVVPAYLLAGCQRMFEHKPWAERQFEQLGLRTLGWRYARDEEQQPLCEALNKYGQLVVRSTYTSGGVGLRRIRSVAEIRQNIPSHADGFIGFSPYLEGALPLNLNACVYADGQVRTFQVSVQLIGIKDCTSLPFGFCGNDFAAAAALDRGTLAQAELAAERVGHWAAGHGYRGQFGLDLLLHEGELFVAEMNARFQASTVLAEEIAEAQEVPGPYLEHLAAFLGLPAPTTTQMPDVRTQTEACAQLVGQCPLSQIICYNDRGTGVWPGGVDTTLLPPDATVVAVPDKDVMISPDAMLCKVFARQRVTSDGYALLEPYSRVREILWTSQLP